MCVIYEAVKYGSEDVHGLWSGLMDCPAQELTRATIICSFCLWQKRLSMVVVLYAKTSVSCVHIGFLSLLGEGKKGCQPLWAN